jgi:hypothetical protein
MSFGPRAKRINAAALLMLAVTAGCTHPSSGTPPSPAYSSPTKTPGATQTLTKAEYLRQANGLCSQLLYRQNQLIKRLGIDASHPTPEQAVAFAAGFAPAARQTFAKIAALPPPPDDAEEVRQILDAYIKVINRIQRATVDHDVAVALAYAPTNWFLPAVQRAFAYGLTSCGF